MAAEQRNMAESVAVCDPYDAVDHASGRLDPVVGVLAHALNTSTAMAAGTQAVCLMCSLHLCAVWRSAVEIDPRHSVVADMTSAS